MGKTKKLASGLAVSLFLLAAAVFVPAEANATSWSGGLHVWDKTHRNSLSTGSFTATSNVGTNVVFTPEGMGPNAHHFTVIATDTATGQTVYYQTMKSMWSMQNPTLDGSLGWTTYKPGTYWLQINAYQADGVGAGMYYTTLTVN